MNTIVINPSSSTQESTSTMKFEASTTINAPIATVFALYANVDAWPSWDPDLKASSLKGAFVSGAVGEVKPHSGPKSELQFVEVIQGKSVRMACKLPLGMMHFDYELQAQAGIGGAATSTLATHRTTFSGLLAPIWSRLIGSGMKKTLPAALAGLKNKAEGK
jgi:Polyketide cyclase / dehydrase and lipid transport